MSAKQLTAEQIEATKAKREAFRKLVKQVADMDAATRVTFASRAWITTCEGHPLSPTNNILTIYQCPEASIVGGFHQWIKQGRAVAKGQHGITIWIPRTGKKKAEGQEQADEGSPAEINFFMGTVFDVSQTIEIEGKGAE